ncbi:hypothetical protein AKJ16_DCAP27427, partial [Drosera capensis]
GLGTNEATNASNKTSRKKKTFAELIEEEVSLLKERSCLKRVRDYDTTFFNSS